MTSAPPTTAPAPPTHQALAKKVATPVFLYGFCVLLTIAGIALAVTAVTEIWIGWGTLFALGAPVVGPVSMFAAYKSHRRMNAFKRRGVVEQGVITKVGKRLVRAEYTYQNRRIPARYDHAIDVRVQPSGSPFRAPPAFKVGAEFEMHPNWDYAVETGATVWLWMTETPEGRDAIVVAIADEDEDVIEIPL